ncbi:hypothetical protein VaNZ11_006274 [Volvox africanus]|uniref:Pherophorin domain-containing protein n=1 Tax=Volvox africanus TaxID=51714 RepID=A0ABQ5S0D6_9CHLO|nr:hypothetical protein VaNZ11_006274 [Volvox africanus]
MPKTNFASCHHDHFETRMWRNSLFFTAVVLSWFARCHSESILFPYSPCQQENVAYKIDPNVYSPVRGTYCFTLAVKELQGCTDTCCSADLDTFELNVNNDNCAISDANLKSTLNGVPTVTSPTIVAAPGGSGAVVLRISNLGLNAATADGTVLCLTVEGDSCTQMDELCVPPDDGNFVCTAALFDSETMCCPVDYTKWPTELSVDPFPPCGVCINAELYPPERDYRPYRFDEEDCDSFQSSVTSALNNIYSNGVVYDFRFHPDPSLCEPTKVSICGTASSIPEIEVLQEAINDYAPVFYDAVTGGEICHPKYENYGVSITVNSCGDFLAQPPNPVIECGLLPPPSINCTCNTTTGVLPYFVSSSIREEPSFNNFTSLYCFDMFVNEDMILPSPCSGLDILRKVEIYADQSLKSFVKSFRLFPSGGSPKTVSPSWGPTGSNLLKVSLYWTKYQATNASVCVEVKKPLTILELCGGWKCYMHLFNPDMKCCPRSTSAP